MESDGQFSLFFFFFFFFIFLLTLDNQIQSNGLWSMSRSAKKDSVYAVQSARAGLS